jgi:hypothetical protein
MKDRQYWKDLEKKIIDAQEKLKEVNSDHPLLKLMEAKPQRITDRDGFCTRYKGLTWEKAFQEYLNELEYAKDSKE